MEVKLIEESDRRMIFEITGENDTFCNLLKRSLQNISGVKIATYRIDHPLIGQPRFLIETTSLTPRQALKKAGDDLKKEFLSFKKEVSKL